jgi:hypothetical protein
MPVLGEDASGGKGAEIPRPEAAAGGSAAPARRGAGVLPLCGNPACASGWLRLWRARQAPVFEGGWLCGAACTGAVVRAALAREMDGREEPPAAHRHRIPLGLVLVSQGAISPEQLKAALSRQKACGGRLGGWLRREHGVEERVVTKGLAAQWGCPVLSLGSHAPGKMAALVPRLLLDVFGVLPLRQAGGRLLYLGFADGIDRCVGFAIERMTGLRVEAGLVDGGDFARAHARLLEESFPPSRLIEAGSREALAASLARIVEGAKPAESRLVRIRDYYWLRMWRRRARLEARLDSVEDVLGSLAGPGC